MGDGDVTKIKIVVDANEADYRQILRERGKKTIRDNRISLLFLLVLLILTLLLTYATVGFLDSKIRYILLAMFMVFGINLVIFGLFLLGIRMQIKSLMGQGERPTTYLFDSNGVKRTSQSFATESSWNRFTKIVENETALLFLVAKESFIAIPKRFFEGGKLPADLRRLIESNAVGEVALLDS